jgi:hypothetical protein
MQIRNLLAATVLFSISIAAVPALAATHATAKKPTTTTLKLSATHFTLGQSGTLTVTVTPKTAAGAATIFYKNLNGGGTENYGLIKITGGHGSAPRKAAKVGTFSVYVVYDGSPSLLRSTSNAVKVTITE